MVHTLSKNWWVLIVQGVIAILFGAGAIAMPGLTLYTLILLYAVTAILDGVAALAGAFTSAGPLAPRWHFIARGVIGLAVGIAVLAWPGLSALLLIYIIAARFLVTGIVELVAAIALRKELENEWLLAVSGILAIIGGAWFVVAPGDGALALAWIIGFFALLIGVTLIGAGLRLREVHKRTAPPEQTSPA